MARRIVTLAVCMGFVLVARAGYAQEPACTISPLRGASSPGGAEGTMVIVNNGRSCGFAVYENPSRQRNPGTEGEVTLAPKHGKVEIQPPRILYTPEPGYSGEDLFAVQMWTGGTKVLLMKFSVKVVVQPPS